MVASAAVAVQDYHFEITGSMLGPEALRALLVDTGIPGTGSDPIGPFPDIAAAIGAFDADLDGWAAADWGGDDCNDTEPDAYPGADEVWYDGIDGDCAADDDFDQDGDGWQAVAHGGDDCDDTDPSVTPENTPAETCASDEPVGPSNADGKASGCSTTSPTGVWSVVFLIRSLPGDVAERSLGEHHEPSTIGMMVQRRPIH